MGELLGILILILLAAAFFKILGFIFQAGFFVVLLPFKILLAVILGVFALLLLPVFIVIPILLAALLPLLLIGLGIAGLVYLLK